MATQIERRAETRDKLLNAAKTLFKKQGFEATTVDRVIKLANVAKGTFYQHFDSKLELLIALMREAGRARRREALSAIDAGAPALAILEQYLESLAESLQAQEKIAEAMVLSSLRDTDVGTANDPELSSRGFIHVALQAAQQQGTIRKDIEAWELTGMIGGFITISVLHWCRNPRCGLLSELLMRSLTLFLEGANVQETTE